MREKKKNEEELKEKNAKISAGNILLSFVKISGNNKRLKKMRVKVSMESDASIKRGKKKKDGEKKMKITLSLRLLPLDNP